MPELKHNRLLVLKGSLFEAQGKVDAKREYLIAEIEEKLQQRTSLKELFTVRWFLI